MAQKTLETGYESAVAVIASISALDFFKNLLNNPLTSQESLRN